MCGLIYLSCLFGQQAELQIYHPAKAVSIIDGAPVAPRSLIYVNLVLRGGGETPSSWFTPGLKPSLTIEQRWFDGPAIPVEILASNLQFPRMTALIPEHVQPGVAALVLRIDDAVVATAPIRIVASEPGIFTSLSGFGPAIAQNTRNGRVEPNALTRPARPGDFVTIWATGLGKTAPADIEATLGEQRLQVQYAGPAPGIKGVDQINLQVPENAGIAEGCYVPLTIKVAGVPANFTTLSTSRTDAPCAHPFGLTARQMAEIDAGGTAPLGFINLWSSVAPPSNQLDRFIRSEGATASFYAMTAPTIAIMGIMERPRPQSEACQVLDPSAGGLIFHGGEPRSVGNRVSLTSAGKQIEIRPDDPSRGGNYSYLAQASAPATPTTDVNLVPPSAWTPGAWVVEAAGSPANGPFRHSFNIPPALQITNYAAVRTIDRTRDLVVEWNAEEQAAEASVRVLLQGSRTVQVTPFTTWTTTIPIACSASASAGKVQIPAALLRDFDIGSDTSRLQLFLWTPASTFNTQSAESERMPVHVQYRSDITVPVTFR